MKKHENSRTDLTELKSGESAIVAQLSGSANVVGRLNAMGIIPGASIVKKSAAPMSGPIVLKKGSIEIAVGYQMAKHIIVYSVDNKSQEKPS